MNKERFLTSLREKLSGLSREDIAERLAFYSEAIDDRMEDGLTEEEAVAQLGTADAIAAQILNEGVQPQPAKKQRRHGALEIVLLILGAPVWFSLLAAAFSVAVSLIAAMWSVVISFWAAEVSIAVGAVAGFAGAGIFCFSGTVPTGLLLLSAALVCAGLSIFGFYGCKATTKGVFFVTKKSAGWIKSLFVRKEGAK